MKFLISNTGLDCTNRLFISDRAHLVFDFHQIVDGLKEVELGGSRYYCLPVFCATLSYIEQYWDHSERNWSGILRQSVAFGPSSTPSL